MNKELYCKICGTEEVDNLDGICNNCKFCIITDKDIPPNLRKEVILIHMTERFKPIMFLSGNGRDTLSLSAEGGLRICRCLQKIVRIE
jgi:hypothetical protein